MKMSEMVEVLNGMIDVFGDHDTDVYIEDYCYDTDIKRYRGIQLVLGDNVTYTCEFGDDI